VIESHFSEILTEPLNPRDLPKTGFN